VKHLALANYQIHRYPAEWLLDIFRGTPASDVEKKEEPCPTPQTDTTPAKDSYYRREDGCTRDF
jgi:hypothetical protein